MYKGKPKKYKLDLEIEHDYTLLGIHSVLEDYRLAYFLNDVCNIKLKRSPNEIVFESKEGAFSNFDYEDQINFTYWNLIKNQQTIALETTDQEQMNLFNEITNTFFLIDEKKNVDYFFKIDGDHHDDEIEKLIKKINSIHRVSTTYQIEPTTLKSKDFLIF